PPVGVWAVLNPSVADRPLRPATDRSLGEPLPHQPANRPRAQLPAPHRSEALLLSPRREAYAVLSAISRRYSSLEGRSPMCYSPVRHSLSPCGERTYDLHVLGTPPAFILSQDQTRHPIDLSSMLTWSISNANGLSCDPGQPPVTVCI